MKITRAEIEKICLEEILSIWQEQPETFPDFLTEISEEQKNRNEETITGIMEQWKKEVTLFPEEKMARLEWKSRMEKHLEELLEKEQILGIRKHMPGEVFEGFQRETKRFVRQTRSFDRKLSMESIWQGLRNYFIYAVIMDLQGEMQECREPAFAYSLLYPYTDNYIDGKEYSKIQKASYNEMIYRILHEEEPTTRNDTEEKTERLLRRLLSYYQKEERETARYLLLQMLEAQEESISQQEGKTEMTEQELLRILVYKGGVSVLVDYFFTTPGMREEEIRFYLKFGFLLQLADDLQDIEEDRKSGVQTLMQSYAKEGNLEKIVNRLLHYTHTIFEGFTPVNDRLKSFMEQHCYSLIMMAAVGEEKYLSAEYVRKVEHFFTVHLEYLQKQKVQNRGKKVSPKSEGQMFSILDLIVME